MASRERSPRRGSSGWQRADPSGAVPGPQYWADSNDNNPEILAIKHAISNLPEKTGEAMIELFTSSGLMLADLDARAVQCLGNLHPTLQEKVISHLLAEKVFLCNSRSKARFLVSACERAKQGALDVRGFGAIDPSKSSLNAVALRATKCVELEPQAYWMEKHVMSSGATPRVAFDIDIAADTAMTSATGSSTCEVRMPLDATVADLIEHVVALGCGIRSNWIKFHDAGGDRGFLKPQHTLAFYNYEPEEYLLSQAGPSSSDKNATGFHRLRLVEKLRGGDKVRNCRSYVVRRTMGTEPLVRAFQREYEENLRRYTSPSRRTGSSKRVSSSDFRRRAVSRAVDEFATSLQQDQIRSEMKIVEAGDLSVGTDQPDRAPLLGAHTRRQRRNVAMQRRSQSRAADSAQAGGLGGSTTAPPPAAGAASVKAPSPAAAMLANAPQMMQQMQAAAANASEMMRQMQVAGAGPQAAPRAVASMGGMTMNPMMMVQMMQRMQGQMKGAGGMPTQLDPQGMAQMQQKMAAAFAKAKAAMAQGSAPPGAAGVSGGPSGGMTGGSQ